ncbi:hypothetical protein Pmar_PMAR008292, partial [Perkinsus marinus ATCC 50983]
VVFPLALLHPLQLIITTHMSPSDIYVWYCPHTRSVDELSC